MATKPRKPRNVIGATGSINKQLKDAFSALPKENEMKAVPPLDATQGNVEEIILDVKEGDISITVTQESSPVVDEAPAAKASVRISPSARAAASQQKTASDLEALEAVNVSNKAAAAKKLADEKLVAEDEAAKAAAAQQPVITKADIGLIINEPVVQGIDVSITATEATATSGVVVKPAVTSVDAFLSDLCDTTAYCGSCDVAIEKLTSLQGKNAADAEIKKAQKEALEKAAEEAKAALTAFNKAA